MLLVGDKLHLLVLEKSMAVGVREFVIAPGLQGKSSGLKKSMTLSRKKQSCQFTLAS